MAESGQDIVKKFLESKGLEVRKIPECNTKTPDFEVYLKGELLFYCEEKTLDYDDFEGFKDDPTYNSISSHVHKAAKQFKSVNPNREVPNLLAFVNNDTLKNVHDLFITLTGQAQLEDGTYMRIHTVGRVANDIDQIDLYLWFDNQSFTNLIWGGIDPQHDEKLKTLF